MRKLQAIKFHPCKFFERTPLKLSGFLLEDMQKNSFVKLAYILKHGNLLLTFIRRATKCCGADVIVESLALRKPIEFVRIKVC